MPSSNAINAMFSLLSQLESIEYIDDLEALVNQMTHAAGFDWFACSVIRPTSLARPDVTIISNVPNEWRDRYSRENMVTFDPVVVAAKAQIRPIFWQQLRAGDEQMQVMDAAHSIGLRDGVSFPLRGPAGERGALSFIRDQVGLGEVQRVALGLVAPHVLEAMVRCSIRATPPQLSSTERAALFWAAAGKKTDEIGIIMAMPARTVTYHIKQAQRKLGATNRAQAVAYASLLGIIAPGMF